jgi:haloacid dehalogenase superfamily, subfamily IA, variant 1 with third motif having Dx(3-4)D or Dx(3-4)E
LIFDWDGTLFDSTGLIVQCIQQACRDLGVAVPTAEAARHVIGLELLIALRTAVPNLSEEEGLRLVERYRHHYFAKQGDVVLFDGVPEFLKQCRDQGYMLAVATGKGRKGLDAALDSIGLRRMFDDTRTADETASKPNPLMLHELVQVLDTPIERALMIGDTSHDIQMAVNAGMPSLAIAHGAHTVQTLSEFNAEQGMLGIVHSIHEMGDWLQQHG